MTRMRARLARLEERLRSAPDVAANRSAAADRVWARIARLTDQFPDSAVGMAEEERTRTLSPADHLAWSTRFAIRPRTISAIMALHGFPVVGTPTSPETANAHR